VSACLDASSFLEELSSYDPDHDRTTPLKFVDIIRQYPYYSGTGKGLYPVNISGFAGMAYCPYKIWHLVRRTPSIRPPRAEIAIQKGKVQHAARESKLLEVVKKAKAATRSQLRDPMVDLVEMPEFPGQFRRKSWLYRAKLDGLARESGNLVVRELKTGRHPRMGDHLLQVWGYCFASPGAVSSATNGDFRAKRLDWEVDYPAVRDCWGPFPFTSNQSRLMVTALKLFESAGALSLVNDDFDLGWRSYPAKCAPCSFAHACKWRVEKREGQTSPPSPLVTLDSFLEGPSQEVAKRAIKNNRNFRNNRPGRRKDASDAAGRIDGAPGFHAGEIRFLTL
jgi:hypothetical protein